MVRLYRTGYELLTTGELQVLRPDAQELLGIRNGSWPYEKVIEFSEEMEYKISAAEKNSPLPSGLNKEKINELYQEIIGEFYEKVID